ncbi:hypothetical protein EAI_07480, partial [Harpegnathos saltator]
DAVTDKTRVAVRKRKINSRIAESSRKKTKKNPTLISHVILKNVQLNISERTLQKRLWEVGI